VVPYTAVPKLGRSAKGAPPRAAPGQGEVLEIEVAGRRRECIQVFDERGRGRFLDEMPPSQRQAGDRRDGIGPGFGRQLIQQGQDGAFALSQDDGIDLLEVG
jgi:hypothetical protein